MSVEATSNCEEVDDSMVLASPATSDRQTVRMHSVAAVSCLVVAILFTFSGLLSTDRVPAYRDLLFFVLPYKDFLAQHLRRAEIPLWNPYSFLGAPFLANLQSGVFYPPSALLMLSFPLGFNLFSLAHYLIALGGIWCLLRSRSLGLGASAIGSLTFVIGGYLVSMLNVTNHLQSIVWAPWVMLIWTRYVASGRQPLLLVVTLVVAVQLLGGSPESLLMTLTLVASWTLYHCSGRWRDLPQYAAALSASMVLVAGLTAFQILPTAEYLQQSVRGAPIPYDRVSSWSTEPISLLQLLLPRTSTLLPDGGPNEIFTIFEDIPPWIASIYLGLVPICLAVSGAIVGRERRFWSAVLLAGLLLALGRHTPLLQILYTALPQFFGKFRYPEKFYFFVHFAASILCAEGAEAFLRQDRVARRVANVAAITFLAIAAIVLLVRWWRPMDFLWSIAILKGRFVYAEEMVPLAFDVTFKSERLTLILGTFLAIQVLKWFSLVEQRNLAILVVGLVAADLCSANRNLNLTNSWSELETVPKLVDPSMFAGGDTRIFHYQQETMTTAEDPGQRVNGLAGWMSGPAWEGAVEDLNKLLWSALFLNVTMIERVPSVAGGDGIQPSSNSKLHTALELVDKHRAVRLLGAFSTAYLAGVGPLSIDGLQEIRRAPQAPVFVYRLLDPLPRVHFVGQLREAADEREAFNLLASPEFPIERAAAVEHIPPDWHDDSEAAASAKISEAQDDDEQRFLRVSLQRRSFLVVNDSFFPGWQATIDGHTTRIYRTNGLVRGVVVPAGDHVVEFRYRPDSWRRGVRISLGSLLVAGALLVASLQYRSQLGRGAR